MILGWKNIKAFKQHIEEMTTFRHAHAHLIPDTTFSPAKTAQAQLPGTPPCPADIAARFTDDKGNNIVVPIWDISVPKGSQN
jgi:hypothetical protein